MSGKADAAEEISRIPQRITSLDRALRILDLISNAKEGLGVTEVSRCLQLDKGLVFRTLLTLVQHNYLEQDPASKRFALSWKVMELAGRRLRDLDLFSTAKPAMKELSRQTGELITLAMIVGESITYMAKEEGSHAVTISARIGEPLSMHSTAVGKAILAFLPDDDLVRLIRPRGLPAFTDKTITDFAKLKEHLAEVRRRGYAIDDEENYFGIRCVAAPVRDHTGSVVASISISGPIQRLTDANLTVLGEAVKSAAEQISTRAGYAPGPEADTLPKVVRL